MSWLWALCEDDERERQQIKELVERWAKYSTADVTVEIFAHTRDIRDAFYRFDAFLLDIFMPGARDDGWMLAERLRAEDKYKPIVFITASEDHQLPAFDLQYVTGYVTKPINEERLFKALDNLRVYLDGQPQSCFSARVSYLDSNSNRYSGLYRLPYRDILFFRREPGGNYTLINDLHEPLLRTTIKELAQNLPSVFRQADRGLIINITRIYQIHDNFVLLDDPLRTRLDIAIGYRQALFGAYANYRMEQIF